jgi:hypothetical protein
MMGYLRAGSLSLLRSRCSASGGGSLVLWFRAAVALGVIVCCACVFPGVALCDVVFSQDAQTGVVSASWWAPDNVTQYEVLVRNRPGGEWWSVDVVDATFEAPIMPPVEAATSGWGVEVYSMRLRIASDATGEWSSDEYLCPEYVPAGGGAPDVSFADACMAVALAVGTCLGVGVVVAAVRWR